MSILAVPEHSQLLLIDPVPQYIEQLDNGLASKLSKQFQRLSEAAEQAQVPRYFAISQDTDDRGHWLSMPCERNKTRVFQFERDRPVWSNTDMVLSMRKEDREQLFICGFWLDDVVMAAALEAQPLGFNTHVIVDLTLCYNAEGRQAALDRLNQYSVAPITVQNLLYEWMAKTEDADRRKYLETLWEEQRSSDQTDTSATRTGLS